MNAQVEALDALARLEKYLGGIQAMACDMERKEQMLLKPDELQEFMTRALEDVARIGVLLTGDSGK